MNPDTPKFSGSEMLHLKMAPHPRCSENIFVKPKELKKSPAPTQRHLHSAPRKIKKEEKPIQSENLIRVAKEKEPETKPAVFLSNPTIVPSRIFFNEEFEVNIDVQFPIPTYYNRKIGFKLVGLSALGEEEIIETTHTYPVKEKAKAGFTLLSNSKWKPENNDFIKAFFIASHKDAEDVKSPIFHIFKSDLSYLLEMTFLNETTAVERELILKPAAGEIASEHWFKLPKETHATVRCEFKRIQEGERYSLYLADEKGKVLETYFENQKFAAWGK